MSSGSLLRRDGDENEVCWRWGLQRWRLSDWSLQEMGVGGWGKRRSWSVA